MTKNLILGVCFRSLGPNLGCKLFFKKIWFSQSLDTMVSYHYVQCQEKASDPILRKISDGWTDRLTDQREEPE